MKKKEKIWEKVNLSEYGRPEDKESNEIATSDAPKITLEDIFPFDEIDILINESDSFYNKAIDDWSSDESEEEQIMRALENGYGDMYGFD